MDTRLVSVQLCESLYLPFWLLVHWSTFLPLPCFFCNTSTLRFCPASCLSLITVASGQYPGMGTGGGVRTSSLTGDSPVSQAEGQDSHSAYCLHKNRWEIPLHLPSLPLCFPRRGSSWDFQLLINGRQSKSLKRMPVMQNSCTYQTVAVTHQACRTNLMDSFLRKRPFTWANKSCFQLWHSFWHSQSHLGCCLFFFWDFWEAFFLFPCTFFP